MKKGKIILRRQKGVSEASFYNLDTMLYSCTYAT